MIQTVRSHEKEYIICLKRYINSYSPALLIANQGNIDVQYIGHLGSKLAYYIRVEVVASNLVRKDQVQYKKYTNS